MATDAGVRLERKPGYASTLRRRAYAWKPYGVNWVQLASPRHLFLHSLESMTLLAQKANLQQQAVVFDSRMLQFWGSEQYVLDVPLADKKSFEVNRDLSPFTKIDIFRFI